ncbi:MAG TPA: class I SAM-dependent methyltransferase [Lapillicoccus sp.]|jgi:ubiquinone/menaquinone biosynthesis C-methylase UbiE|nr:class I SAM-dependent methyltransferase [Lapillicoccus sp.]
MSTDRITVSAVQGEVPEAFDEVAHRYDLMVALNPGYHAHLRQSARALVKGLIPGVGSRVVDLGCGSGASTRALVAELNRAGVRAEVLGVDGSAGMLEQAERKAWPSWVRFAQSRAESLESVCADAGFQPLDAVFAAYLLRNVPDRDALLRSVHDLLRPGGTLVVHEYSVAGRPVSEAVWTAVCRGVVVPLGWLTSRRTRLYHYLWRSVMDMDSVEQVMQRMVDAGFEDVRSRSVRGWQRGIIHTFHGRRPR